MRIEDWRAGRAWATNAVLCLLGVGLLLLTKQFVIESDHFVIGFSGASGWSVWLYLAALLVVWTQPTDRWTFPIIIGFAVAFQAVTVFADPFLSSDIYRYVWDGLVQHAHISPYRYVPGDPALKFLREPNQDIFDNINRRDYARTIYPPVAQMMYYAITFFSPTVTAMKAAMIGFECLTAWALVRIFGQLRVPRTRLLVFAWCPLLVWEIGGSGHVDAAVFAFVTLALLFRLRDRPWLTGLFLGLAVMTKFYPLVLLPALWQRRDWRMPTALVAVCAVGYALYSSVGWLVFGFLSGYAKEEGIDSGARFFPLDLVQHVHGLENTPTGAYKVFCAAVLGAICWWAWKHATVESLSSHPSPAHSSSSHPARKTRAMNGAPGAMDAAPRRSAVLGASMALGFALMLLFSPHYPWYVAWLVPLLALVPNVPLLTYLMMFFYMFTTSLADPGPKMYLLNKIMYGAVTASFLLWFALRRVNVWRWLDCPAVEEKERVRSVAR